MRPTERRSTRPAPQARSLPPSLHCCFLRQPDPAGRPPLEDGRLSPCCGLLAGRARSGHGMVAAPVSPAPRDRRARQRHTSESARVVDVPSEGVSPASPGTLAHSESAAQMRPRSGLGFSAGRLPSLLFRVFSSESSLPSLLFRVSGRQSARARCPPAGARGPRWSRCQPRVHARRRRRRQATGPRASESPGPLSISPCQASGPGSPKKRSTRAEARAARAGWAAWNRRGSGPQMQHTAQRRFRTGGRLTGRGRRAASCLVRAACSRIGARRCPVGFSLPRLPVLSCSSCQLSELPLSLSLPSLPLAGLSCSSWPVSVEPLALATQGRVRAPRVESFWLSQLEAAASEPADAAASRPTTGASVFASVARHCRNQNMRPMTGASVFGSMEYRK